MPANPNPENTTETLLGTVRLVPQEQVFVQSALQHHNWCNKAWQCERLCHQLKHWDKWVLTAPSHL